MRSLTVFLLLGVFVATSYAASIDVVAAVPHEINNVVPDNLRKNPIKCAKAIAEAAKLITGSIVPELPRIIQCANVKPPTGNSLKQILEFLKRVLVDAPQCISEKVEKVIYRLEELDKIISKC